MDANALTFAKAIADETRQQIMDCICCEWCSVGDLVDKLGGKVNQPTVSHHLKLLQDANLVQVRQEGRHRFYTLNQTAVTVCCNLLVQQFAPNFAQDAVISVGSIRVKD